ncbi:5-deoxy-glucuronate isomerase [Anaerotaenia torta]|uniref:5-deoxy-glucuronate isomerase n=1 Tax=Anaerotaenia torta TaxID=433293 RepID=UPI003D24151E
MFDYPAFNEEGKKIVSRIDGINREMWMDITVFRMKKGQEYEFYENGKEMALLLLGGSLEYGWASGTHTARRKDVFTDAPYCLHVCRDNKVIVRAREDSELLVQATDNERSFPGRLYGPEDCKIELMGEAQWEGTAKREVLTIFDYHNAPYSNMVMGEVITKAGRWSSYIPHSHPQPEVYYYKFERPQGFGACFIGDNVYKVLDGSAASIPGGLTHPQTAAPGYHMYYCWMIRHLENNPWTTRDNDPAHEWLISL